MNRFVVLLINDNESIIDRTARMLEDMGWEAHVASSQKDALSECTDRRPSLAVVDIEMRGGAGLETISRLRRANKELFILAVTRGRRDDALLKVAEVCGANRHLIGPVSATKLSAAIEAGLVNGSIQPGP